jgi:hypothetical protein
VEEEGCRVVVASRLSEPGTCFEKGSDLDCASRTAVASAIVPGSLQDWGMEAGCGEWLTDWTEVKGANDVGATGELGRR